jgi:hypothetical protein
MKLNQVRCPLNLLQRLLATLYFKLTYSHDFNPVTPPITRSFAAILEARIGGEIVWQQRLVRHYS